MEDLRSVEGGVQNVVISQTLASTLFGSEPAVGRSIMQRRYRGPARELTIVGVPRTSE